MIVDIAVASLFNSNPKFTQKTLEWTWENLMNLAYDDSNGLNKNEFHQNVCHLPKSYNNMVIWNSKRIRVQVRIFKKSNVSHLII